MVTQRINLNLIPGGVLPRINVSQYDTGSRTLELVLYNGETAFNVPAGANVQIVGTKRDDTGFEYSCTYTDNVVSVDITDQMTVFGGEVVTELRILKDDDQLGTGNFIINVEPTALKDDVVISETDIPIIQQLPSLIAQAESSAELAHQWADYGDESDTPSATNNAKYWSIQAAAAAAGCLRPAIVPSLPTSDISTVTLYFVPSSDPGTGNLYDEYINTDGTSAGWELIGSTGVDLSAYLQKTGDSKDNTVTYTSADDDTVFNSGNLGGAYAWTAANSLASGEKHSVLFNKISTMLKNLRTIAKLIGTADISTIGTSPNTGTVTGAIAKINSDLSELNVVDYDLNGINLSAYTSEDNSYTFPSNGILHLGVGAVSGTNAVSYALQNRNKTAYMVVGVEGNSGYRSHTVINVYKGQHTWNFGGGVGTWFATFYPFITE